MEASKIVKEGAFQEEGELAECYKSPSVPEVAVRAIGYEGSVAMNESSLMNRIGEKSSTEGRSVLGYQLGFCAKRGKSSG